MSKRPREEDDELVKRITQQVVKSLRTTAPPVEEPPPAPTNQKRKQVSVKTLLFTFKRILQDVLREDGLVLVSDADSLVEFKGVIPYPFEMNYELQMEIKSAARQMGGAAWHLCNASEEGEVIQIYFTQDNTLQIVKSGQAEQEYHERLDRFEKMKMNIKEKLVGEWGMMSHSLMSHLGLDVNTAAKFSERAVGDGLVVISATVLLDEPLRSHQVEKIAVNQAEKLKAITWGKHQIQNKTRFTLEVKSPKPSIQKKEQQVEG